jgi:predicted cobalt transporter CbtA
MEGKMIGIIMLLLLGFVVAIGMAFIFIGLMRLTGLSWKEIGIIWGVAIFLAGWIALATFLAERGI